MIPETIIQERFEETTILFQSVPAASWKDIDDIFKMIDNTPNSSMHLAEYLRNEVRMRIKLGSQLRYVYCLSNYNYQIIRIMPILVVF